MVAAFVHFSPKDENPKLTSGNWLIEDVTVEYVLGGSDTSFKAMGLLPNTFYEFAVVAFDKALNLSNISNTVSIKTKSDGPYLVSPIAIPGKVEMEYFDFGGEGIAYHDAQSEHFGDICTKVNLVNLLGSCLKDCLSLKS